MTPAARSDAETIRVLRSGLGAAKALVAHQISVLGGWDDCPACQAASNQCDGSLACDNARQAMAALDRAYFLPDPS
ncbi:hypothetical protein B4N89_20730 [Embleya scabrispora]|uniref:Uncharacterized protein n=1 Tax=Embleya scabrispora TaxID=159449 RepID=A0A1T3P2C2_9ACTN|nr:hypothetical protein [Embleya scabrispora]OPC83040.1 hypothetical protein B4N89_20730 [Embleya scabrispora]